MNRFTRMPVPTQKWVAGVFVVVCVGVGALLSWQSHQRVDLAHTRLESSLANRQAMAELVRRFESRQSSGLETDLSAVVTRSLEGKSFQPSLVQQQNGEMALRLDNAPFNDVLAWLRELEETGTVVLGNVGISEAQPAGVTVTLVLRGG